MLMGVYFSKNIPSQALAIIATSLSSRFCDRFVVKMQAISKKNHKMQHLVNIKMKILICLKIYGDVVYIKVKFLFALM